MGSVSPFEQLDVPGMVVVEVGVTDPLDPLLPGEASPGTDPAGRRYRELQAGRHCAARALLQVGVARRPLLSDAAGAPRWPSGWAGSITHSGGRCAAAIVERAAALSIGIDMERPRPISERAASRVCSPAELVAFETLPPIGVAWPLVVFSAKESFYKAWWPWHRRRLGFRDVRVELTAAAAAGATEMRFQANHASGMPEAQDVALFQGRMVVGAGWVRTAVWVSPPS